jgi:hypothetical protein
MVSQINPAFPLSGATPGPSAFSVRENFQAAHDEIEALQALVETGPFLPLTGGVITGMTDIIAPTAAPSSLRLNRGPGTQGIRFNHAANFATIEAVDSSFGVTYETLRLYGSRLQLGTQGGAVDQIDIQGNNIAISSPITASNFITVRHGANPGITIENTGAAPTFGLQVGGNPATLWFRTVNSATNAPVANLAAISSTGKFSVLGGASDPFELTVPSGMSARAWFTITGNRTWSVGPRADGAFEIGDQTGQIGRMVLGTGGLMQYFGAVNVNGVLTVAGTGLGAPLPPGDEGVVLPALDDLPATRTTAGDRIILYADIGPFDFTIGISGGTMWFGNRGPADQFIWYSGADPIATLTGNGTFRISGDFVLNRQDAATGWITRPNVAGFRNLGFAAAGGGPLDTLTINAAETSISGNLSLSNILTTGNQIMCGGNGVVFMAFDANATGFGWDEAGFHAFANGTWMGTIQIAPPGGARSKTNVAPVTKDALAAVRAIELAAYDRINLINPEAPPRRDEVGFVAEQLREVIPEAVADGDDDRLSLDLMPILAHAIGAIQQLAARVEQLTHDGDDR